MTYSVCCALFMYYFMFLITYVFYYLCSTFDFKVCIRNTISIVFILLLLCFLVVRLLSLKIYFISVSLSLFLSYKS